MKNVIILISGRGSNMKAIVEETRSGILKDLCRIQAVFSNDKEAAGLKTAAEYNISTHIISSAGRSRGEYNDLLLNWLDMEDPDYLILAGYMRILPAAIVRRFRCRIINIHPADTKKHQGLYGYRWAWQNKLQETKITIHYVDEGLDTGSIIAQYPVDLKGVNSLEEVQTRGLKVEHKSYSRTLAGIFSTQDPKLTTQEIAIIDFGGQYTHLIARRIRKLGVFSEIYDPEEFKMSAKTSGIIFSGGPQSVTAESAYKTELDLNVLPVPLLGICYGHQLIASLTGGVISDGNKPEYGDAQITCEMENTLFAGTAEQQKVWMSHGDQVVKLPVGYKITAVTESVPIAAYESEDGKIAGVQFHPEVVHTEFGNTILDNFLKRCTEERTWKVENYKDRLVNAVKEQVEDKEVLILLSGGVDSLVAMELCLNALGQKRVHAIHIDTGFMRLNESEEIVKHLKELGYTGLRLIKAEERFSRELKNVVDPEKKRLIIGRIFAEIAGETLAEFRDKDLLLVQGTIYPDTIESGASRKSAKIKTHHNRVAEIEEMIAQGRVIEPIKELYKDEVRELGMELNIPGHLVNRHPFPGPGLAIRILASDSDEAEKGYDSENDRLNRFAAEFNLKGMILPLKSVGVMGDYRTYKHPALVWFKASEAGWNWVILSRAATKLVNNLSTVNRVVFTLQPPKSDYRLQKHFLNKKACDNLRRVDSLLMKRTDHLTGIWQMPVVQLPLFDKQGRQVYLMRPVTSIDAMTAGFFEMDFQLLSELTGQVRSECDVADVFYDITSKPPATIEWE